MIDLTLIGIGTGNPEHVTLQAVRAINQADLILIPLKGEDKADLAHLRRHLCAEHVTKSETKIVEFSLPVRDAANSSYLLGVGDWHDAVAGAWEREIRSVTGENGEVVMLVWGDPCLYDSTLRLANRLARKMPVSIRVIPGITAIQALCAAHAIPLNEIAKPVQITTGRQLRDHGWPEATETVVIMLDGECSFSDLDPAGIEIWWGAYLGMSAEVLRAGRLVDHRESIPALRAELREEHGWIMDIYLMRRELGESETA